MEKYKHYKNLLDEFEKFRKTIDFNSIHSLKKMILWVNENNEYISDNVADYDNLNLFELQSFFIHREIDVLGYLLKYDLYKKRKSSSKLINLREELIKESRKIGSYINKEEYLSK